MNRYAGGFTIIELMIVVTVIVIVAMIAVPSLISARLVANETAAIETLSSIRTAQAQFRTSGKADEDADGTGEHGSFGELSGATGVRGGPIKVPTDLTGSMRLVTASGEIEKSGYIFRMYLPDNLGQGVREQAGGGFPIGALDPDLSEGYWCCYAWPARYGVSGRRAFVATQGGGIRFVDGERYQGGNCADIRPGVSFMTGNLDSMTGDPAVGVQGADGLIWRPIQ